MAIYSWLCKCGVTKETTQGIAAYSDPATRSVPIHCEIPMERMLTVNGGYNYLAGDRHYDGLAASDGTLINTRTKHQEYMKRNGLTIADDYKGEWKKAEVDRRARLDGKITSNRALIEREFTKALQK